MPNHITNRLKVTGSNEQVKKLFNKVSFNPMDFVKSKIFIASLHIEVHVEGFIVAIYISHFAG